MSDEFKIKNIKSKFASHIRLVLPLIEEMIDEGVQPIALIGFSPKRGRVIHAHFATVSDDENTQAALVEICKQFLNSIETEKLEK